jgi:hypothetical protein
MFNLRIVDVISWAHRLDKTLTKIILPHLSNCTTWFAIMLCKIMRPGMFTCRHSLSWMATGQQPMNYEIARAIPQSVYCLHVRSIDTTIMDGSNGLESSRSDLIALLHSSSVKKMTKITCRPFDTTHNSIEKNCSVSGRRTVHNLQGTILDDFWWLDE